MNDFSKIPKLFSNIHESVSKRITACKAISKENTSNRQPKYNQEMHIKIFGTEKIN